MSKLDLYLATSTTNPVQIQLRTDPIKIRCPNSINVNAEDDWLLLNKLLIVIVRIAISLIYIK